MNHFLIEFLPDTFLVHCGITEEDALYPFPLNCSPKYALAKARDNQEGLAEHVYTDDVNLSGIM